MKKEIIGYRRVYYCNKLKEDRTYTVTIKEFKTLEIKNLSEYSPIYNK